MKTLIKSKLQIANQAKTILKNHLQKGFRTKLHLRNEAILTQKIIRDIDLHVSSYLISSERRKQSSHCKSWSSIFK